MSSGTLIVDRDTNARAVYTVDPSTGLPIGSGTSSSQVQGNVAHDSVDAGNPVKIGGYASGTAPAAVAAGDRVNGWYTLRGAGMMVMTDAGGSLTSSMYQGIADAYNGANPGVVTANFGLVLNRRTGTWDRQTGSIVPVVGSAVTGLLVKASGGSFFSGAMTAGATAGFFILYNAAAIPGSGAALTAAQILAVVPVAANGYATIGEGAIADGCDTGIVLLFSTSTTTYTVPANAALHMRGRGF